jgi:hypothetical protein
MLVKSGGWFGRNRIFNDQPKQASPEQAADYKGRNMDKFHRIQ